MGCASMGSMVDLACWRCNRRQVKLLELREKSSKVSAEQIVKLKVSQLFGDTQTSSDELDLQSA
jgi:hypothetical protein